MAQKRDGMPTVPAKTIVTRIKGSWFGADYTMNLYRGCCHGCIYCDSRSECYRIEEFDTVRVKEDALRLVRDDLRRKVKPGVVATGAMSDPYNPFEKSYEYTRNALELLNAFEFGVFITTKSDLIVRDADILRDIRRHSPVLCMLTVTAAQDSLCEKVEPNVAVSSRRFEAIRQLRAAGIPTGVMLMPVLPFLEDTRENIRGILQAAAQSGANYVYPSFGMTLRGSQREWYYQKLEEQFPGQGLPQRYRSRYGERYSCTSPKARELWGFFTELADSLGLLYRMPDIVNSYRMGYDTPMQLRLY